MAPEHVTDEEIQGFLDGSASRPEAIRTHSGSCPVCAKKINEYRRLFASLADDRGFDLPPGFAAATAARIARAKRAAPRAWVVNAVLVGAVIAGCMLVASIFIDFSPVWDGLKQILAENFGAKSAAISAAHAFLAALGIKAGLLASAVATMFLIAVADWILAALRRNTTPFIV